MSSASQSNLDKQLGDGYTLQDKINQINERLDRLAIILGVQLDPDLTIFNKLDFLIGVLQRCKGMSEK